jgi:alpha-mannosidase
MQQFLHRTPGEFANLAPMRFRLLLVVFLSSVLTAQSFTPVRELKNLSPSALAKLHTLETLSALPGGDWRFHAGDIPHGESATLDDSAWALVAAPTGRTDRVKAPKEAVWYRRTIEVPRTLNGYDITGSRIWFQFRADANGPIPQIVYFNGKRVALGDDLEPIVLFEPARPGDKVLVAVKLLNTVDEKTFTGVNLRIEPITDVANSRARPNPQDLRIQCITAANLLPALPTPRTDLLPTVESAIAAIDTGALTTGNQAAFDASLLKAQSLLAPLHAVLAQDSVTLAGNSHIDAAWLWPRSETIDVVKRTFTTALQLMNEYPDYTFTQSAAQYSEWMADKYPELNAQIAQRVKEGRWEIVGGMWVEPDLNLPGGESLVRQLLVGQREFKQLYGVTARIGWNPDSFGYNWQLPQIYKRSGMDYFVTQKMHWNDTNTLPFRLFWWESPDGSKVLTYFPTDYVHDNINPTRISADFAESAQRNPGLTEHLDLYGIGDHGGGPTRDMLDQGDHWVAESKQPTTAIPQMHYGTAQSYFDSVQNHLNPTSPTWNYESIAKGYTPPAAGAYGMFGIPTWKDELYFEYHRGIFTTQAAHKRNLRQSETATLDAEKLASLAWLDGSAYPADVLTENWKKITFNQFHDLAAGSGIGVIYRDAAKDFGEVFNEDAIVSQASMGSLTSSIDTSVGMLGMTPFVVANTLPWARSGTVEVALQLPYTVQESNFHPGDSYRLITDGNAHQPLAQVVGVVGSSHTLRLLVGAQNLPSLGYKVMTDLPGLSGIWKEDKSNLSLRKNGDSYSLSNGHLQLIVMINTGCIASLSIRGADLKASESIASNVCANQLQTYVDKPKQYDAWNVDPGTLDGPMTPISNVDSIKVIADGPLRKTIRITRTWQSSKFVQDISLDANSDFVRVDNDIDWHETHVLLKVAFPLAASSGKATYEIPYGAIQRPTTRNNSWEKAQFEVPALRWADLGDDKQGVSILNDSKYGYDAVGNTLRLTLLRSPTWPDPDADRGLQHFTYEIYPHMGTWQQAETVHRGYELNTPLTAQQVFPHTGSLPPTHSFASVDEPNIILSAVKKAEDSDALIFRVYDATGKGGPMHLQVPPGATGAAEVNLMEAPVAGAPALAIEKDTITLPMKPWEIRTIAVQYPGTGK